MIIKKECNKIMKEKRNAEYLAMLDKSMAEAEAGGYTPVKDVRKIKQEKYKEYAFLYMHESIVLFKFLSWKENTTSSCDKHEKLTTFVTNYRFQTWKIKENKCFRSVRNLKKL